MNFTEQSTAVISSVSDLIATLKEEDVENFGHIIKSLDLPLKAYEKYSSWSDDCYTRNCIAENDKFELILLCWDNKQKTPIHNHGGEECWVKILEGEFEENIYKKEDAGELTLLRSTKSKEKDISYMIDFMGYHSLQNLSNKKSVTLHLYAKPIRNCLIFCEESQTFVNKEMAYSTFA